MVRRQPVPASASQPVPASVKHPSLHLTQFPVDTCHTPMDINSSYKTGKIKNYIFKNYGTPK